MPAGDGNRIAVAASPAREQVPPAIAAAAASISSSPAPGSSEPSRAGAIEPPVLQGTGWRAQTKNPRQTQQQAKPTNRVDGFPQQRAGQERHQQRLRINQHRTQTGAGALEPLGQQAMEQGAIHQANSSSQANRGDPPARDAAADGQPAATPQPPAESAAKPRSAARSPAAAVSSPPSPYPTGQRAAASPAR